MLWQMQGYQAQKGITVNSSISLVNKQFTDKEKEQGLQTECDH